MYDIGSKIDIRAHFAEERRDLLTLLTSLQPDEWWIPTVCGDWCVHDVAVHILGGDFNNLSGGRDKFGGSPLEPNPGDLTDWPRLVAFIDHRNAIWNEAARRISLRLIIELLTWSGTQLEAWWPTVDLDGFGIPVSWAGPDPAPTWLHLARELTERWTHQQHIRQATDRPGGADPEIVHAVLDTFARALPYALRDVIAPAGSTAILEIRGAGGGTWTVNRTDNGWTFAGEVSTDGDCHVVTDVGSAWQSFTLGLGPTERRSRMSYSGDPSIANAIVDMVTIIG